MELSPLILLLLFLRPSIATWYRKESKMCDPRAKKIYPFTGFKIYRVYQIDGVLLPESISLLSIGHCDHGKKDFEQAIVTTSGTDIDWNKVFCMLKPGHIPRSQSKSHKSFNVKVKDSEISADNRSYAASTPGVSSKVGKVFQDIKNTFRSLFDKKLEKSTEGKYIEYTGKKSIEHLQTNSHPDPQSALDWESRNMVCYKMARRQKYARRNITFYMPGTFVGGIFECPLNSEQRMQIFQNYTSNDFLTLANIVCDPSISRPILPLIAQDITNQWLDLKLKSGLFPLLKQTIPYLATPGPFDPRFAILNTPDMFLDTWASQIAVNEDYIYSNFDLHVISTAIAKSSDYLNRIISPITISSAWGPLSVGTLIPDITESPELSKNNIGVSLMNVTLDQKLNLAFSKSTKQGLAHLKKLLEFWD